jgi:predicted kinase
VKRLVLLVGIPGCGKTTLSKQLIERGYLRLNADDIRNELLGAEIDTRNPQDNERVFGEFFRRLEKALSEQQDIVVDNTNINAKHRGPILQRAIKSGYQDIQLWIMDVPLEICLERNRSRPRSVPDDIVRNYYNTLQGHGRPSKHEGKLIVVRPAEQEFQFRFYPIEK